MAKVTIRTIDYIPSFKGPHNSVRAKCYLVLYNRYLEGQRGLTLAELASQTTGNYKSISVLLVNWIKWGYVGYRSYPSRRRYHILKRGWAWLDRHQDTMPLARYITEIEAQQTG